MKLQKIVRGADPLAQQGLDVLPVLKTIRIALNIA